MTWQGADGGAALWEKVRRLLARMVSSVQVRDVTPTDAARAVIVAGDGSLHGLDPDAGEKEATWRPSAQVRLHGCPHAEAGGADADSCGVACMVGANGVVPNQGVAVHESAPLFVSAVTHRQEVFDGRAVPIAVHRGQVAAAGGAARAGAARIAVPQTDRLLIEPPRMPSHPVSGRARLMRRDPRREDVLSLRVRVAGSLTAAAEVPMLRSRRPAPAGWRFADAFGAERRELARASQLDWNDVALIGIYPQVPIAAVARLGLEDGGSDLSLWLKPEASAWASHGKPPRLVTLIVGRQRSTGRMIQTIG